MSNVTEIWKFDRPSKHHIDNIPPSSTPPLQVMNPFDPKDADIALPSDRNDGNDFRSGIDDDEVATPKYVAMALKNGIGDFGMMFLDFSDEEPAVDEEKTQKRNKRATSTNKGSRKSKRKRERTK